MITAEYARVMARYNRWQNVSIYAAAEALGDAARRADRGAFFGSIHRTLSHLLWGDMIWMSRFAGLDAPPVANIGESPDMIESWADMQSRRKALDAQIAEWAQTLSDDQISRDLTWHSGVLNREITRPFADLLVHFFNHQTHHRGQVHAMITAAGGRPDDTDLFIMQVENRA